MQYFLLLKNDSEKDAHYDSNLLGDESFDMIDQLDFYSWLEQQSENLLHDNSFEEVG